jgi:hypothetical protein
MDIMSMETHGAPARLLYRSFRAFLKTRCGDYAVGYERPLSGGATAAPGSGDSALAAAQAPRLAGWRARVREASRARRGLALAAASKMLTESENKLKTR